MRDSKDPTTQEKTYVMGLDIGAWYIHCLIYDVSTGEAKLAGLSCIHTGWPDKGKWQKEEIVKDEEVAVDVLKAIDEACDGLDISFSQVAIGVAHRLVRTVQERRDGEEILYSSINTKRTKDASAGSVSEVAQLPLEKDRFVIVPEFALQPYRSIVKVLRAESFSFSFTPIAALKGAADPQQMAEGVLLIEIRAQSCGCAFWKNSMLHAAFGMTVSLTQFLRNVDFREPQFIRVQELMDKQPEAVELYEEHWASRVMFFRKQLKTIAGRILTEMSSHGIDLVDLPETILLAGESGLAAHIVHALEDLLEREVVFISHQEVENFPGKRFDVSTNWGTVYGLAVDAINLRKRQNVLTEQTEGSHAKDGVLHKHNKL